LYFVIVVNFFLLCGILFPVLTDNSCNLTHLFSCSPPNRQNMNTKNKQTNKQTINIVAAAIIGGYFGLYILIKIKGAISGSAPVEEAAPVVAAVPSSAGAIPDVDSEEFGAFLESEDNIMKLVESFEK